MRFTKLIVIHAMKSGALVFPAKIYVFGRRAVDHNRFQQLNKNFRRAA